MKSVIFGFLLMLAAAAAQQASAETKVYVAHTGDDQVGRRLAFALREALRKSATFEDTYEEASSFFSVSVITLDPDNSTQQARTIYTFVITLRAEQGFNGYITSSVGFCGDDILAECAESMVQDLGVRLDQARRAGFKTE